MIPCATPGRLNPGTQDWGAALLCGPCDRVLQLNHHLDQLREDRRCDVALWLEGIARDLSEMAETCQADLRPGLDHASAHVWAVMLQVHPEDPTSSGEEGDGDAMGS